MKTTKLTAVLVLCSLMLVSCASLLDKLGFDTYDYMSAPILSTHPADGETADMLEDWAEARSWAEEDRIFAAIQEGKAKLKANGNPDVALEVFLLELRELLRKA